MSIDWARAAGAGLFFVLIFLSGLRLSRPGKPYGAVPFNMHKLIGLAAGVFLIVTVIQAHRALPLLPVEIGAVAATVLLFAGTVVAGGLLNIDKPMPAPVRLVHRVLPYIIVLSTAATLYLLLGHR